MEKKLTPLDLSRLDYSQTAELVKQHVGDVENPANGITLTEDTPLNDFIVKLKADLETFEVYLKNAQKSEYTEPLTRADKARENYLRAINRYMRLLQLETDEEQKEAFRLLEIVWKVHKNLVSESDENQTIGIDNLLMDFGDVKLTSHVEKSGIKPYLDRLEASNVIYKTILKDRNAQYAERVVREGIRLIQQLQRTYKQYARFVVSMANLYADNAQWDKLLSLLNVSRKKFATLLAQQKKAKKEIKTEDGITTEEE